MAASAYPSVRGEEGVHPARPVRTGTWETTSRQQAGKVVTSAHGTIVSKEALARWSEHVDTLSSEQRRMFLAKLPDNALPRYAELVNSVLDEKFRNSKVIRVTKWIQPLVSFLDLCKPLTDGLRDIYPPAGAILGGVLFALSITKRFVKYQEALVQFLSKVMDGLGQLDRFRDAFPDTPEIQETLVDIFDIILRICARASSIFIDKKGRGKSAARLILKSFDKDFGELKEMLATNIETFDRTIQLVSGRKLGYLEEAQMTGLRMQLETYKEIRKLEAKRTQEERERIARETEREQDERRHRLLSWLSSLSFQGTQDSILATTLNGTGKWLLSHQTYTSWRERSAAGLLWVCGKHGSGKSHLAAQVIEELKELCQESNGMIATNQEYIEMEDEVPPHLEVPGVDMPSVDLPGAQQALMLHSNDNIPGDTLEGLAADAHRNLSTEMRNFHGADLEVAEQRSDRVALAYIYCNSERVRRSERVKAVRTAGSGADYDTTGLLSSLLKQLYQFLPKDQDVPALSDLCFESKQDYPSREDISKGITSVVQMFKQVFIVIDGLDECSGLDSLEFETFCNFLASLAEPDGTRSPAHVLIFSRPGYPAINNAMHGCPVVEVDQGANSDDIGRFIGDRSRSLKIDSKSLEVIQGYLQDSADGMFLWVSLTIDSIKNERKPKNMKAAAKNVPKGLSGAYADALKRVIRKEASIRDLALKALLWVANSKAPLSEPQLLEALVIEPEMTSIDDDEKIDGTQLTTDCEDLLVLRDGQYTLLHTSLGDFLRSVPTLGLEDLQIYSTLQAQAPRILVEDCITYFKFDAFATGPQATEDTFDEVLQDHPFLVYAAMFWGDHLREAIEQGAPELESLVIDLLSTQSSREFLHQIRLARDASIKQTNPGLLGQLFPFPSGTTALHVLSIFGLDSLLSADGFRRADLDIGHADGLGYYAIDYAIRYSRRQMCHWIVAEFLKQNDRDEDTTSKLRIACNSETWLMGGVIEHHWTDVLSNLIKLGYSAMERPLEDNRDTALHLAARLGYVDIMDLLLNMWPDPNIRNHSGETPLITAASCNHLDVMTSLLRHSADVSCTRWDGATALHLVAAFDDADIIATLINKGANVGSTWGCFTPLHIAAGSGNEGVIATLLEYGANIEATASFGPTPLIHAVCEGRIDAVRALLHSGADITAKDHKQDDSILTHAAWRDHVDIVSLILEVQAPLGTSMINHRNTYGSTALHISAWRGSTASAIKLLEHDAHVDPEDKFGCTPAMLSLLQGHTSLASVLFDQYGADPGHIDHDGSTTLHMAARSGRPEHIQRLLSCGVDVLSKDHFDHTALYYAIRAGHVHFVEVLVGIMTSMNILQTNEESLLRFASEKGYHEIVKCLIHWNPEMLTSRAEDEDLPLHRAACFGHIRCVEHLCNSETVDLPGASGRTALHYAIIDDNLPMVEFLLRSGADVNAAGRSHKHRNSPLLEALEEGNHDIVDILLDHDADFEAMDEENWRPIHFAACRGRTALVSRLLKMGCDPNAQTDQGATPFFLALSRNYTDTVELLWPYVQSNNLQLSRSGASYAHVAAMRGRLELLQRMLDLDKTIIYTIDADDDDPLSLAAGAGEYAIVDLLIECGMDPNGAKTPRAIPLVRASMSGSIRTVRTLLRRGARVDQPGPYMRPALSCAVSNGELRVVQELLKAGANPHVKDAMGLSSIDLAFGCPPMMALLKPWIGPSHGSCDGPTDHIESLARFISRTSRSLALMSELETKSYRSYSLIGRRSHLSALCRALRRLALAPHVVLNPHARISSGRISSVLTLQPASVKQVEVIREWRLVQSDTEFDLGSCSHCRRDIERSRKSHVCLVCSMALCNHCYSPVSAGLPPSQYLEPLRELLQLEEESSFILDALKAIAHQDAMFLNRVLCQDNKLKCWVYSKHRSYRIWQRDYVRLDDRNFYTHFRKRDFVGWNAVHIMACSLSLAASNTDSTRDMANKTSCSKLTERWRDVYAFNNTDRGKSNRSLCPHQRFMDVKPSDIVSVDGHAVHDSSGIISFEVFEALATKYEHAISNGAITLEKLQSTRLSDWLFGGPRAESGLLSPLMSSEFITDHSTTEIVDASEDSDANSVTSIISSESASTASSKSESLDSLGESSDQVADDFQITEGWIEDILDNLLEKMNTLAQEAPQRSETELVLETAWTMAQTIVYHDTPRPSLKEMSEQSVGYYTAPASPAASDLHQDGSSGSLTFYTARSISPVSWFLEDGI